MRIFDWILGRYLADSESEEQRVGPISGIPMLGLDALTSSAYGTEAALSILLPLGALSLNYVLPISSIIIGLLFIVFISYRQTIEAYPTGGGSYTVAKENLGIVPGVLAAAALLLDYVLTVAVGIAAGVGALISAVPVLEPYVLPLCLFILLVITIINLRGIKESSRAFMIPTYLFIFSLLGVLFFGLYKTLVSGGHPVPVESMPNVAALTIQGPVTWWLLLRAFASGCAAMTGVEAVSNGVKAFREPVVDNARRTLTIIIVILMLMLAGIAYLTSVYQLIPTDSNAPGYESLVSQLIRAIVGKGLAYYVTMGSTITVLAISANTAFADFPRLCQIIANDDFLPHAFAERGRRLVFSIGILALTILSAILLIGFGGITDNLIPLYAIGAFLAFTLSQAGMVVHWYREGTAHIGKLLINALGAAATGITMMVVLVSKFTEGGWISLTVVAVLLFIFYGVHFHYKDVRDEIMTDEPLTLEHIQQPIAIVPFRDWSKITRKALGYAIQMSNEVYAVHVLRGEDHIAEVERNFKKFVLDPCLEANIKPPTLVNLESPYRRLFGSLLQFIDDIERTSPHRHVAIVIPELAEHRWYHYFLHNQRAVLLRAVLSRRRDQKVIMVRVPWYLKS